MTLFLQSTIALALSFAQVDAPAAEPPISDGAEEEARQARAHCAVDNPARECGPGLWIGPLAVCDSTSVESRLSYDDGTGFPVLILELGGQLRDALAELTTNMVGQPLPVRFNGKTLIEPIVEEPIMSGGMTISSLDAEELKAIQTVLRQCKGNGDAIA